MAATKVQGLGGEWVDVKLGRLAQVVAGQPVAEARDLPSAARWESAARFGQTLTLAAQRRHLDGATRVVSPNDGAPWSQDVVDRIAVRILDAPHAAEHLTTSSPVVPGPPGLAAADWVARQRSALLGHPAGPALLLAESARCLALARAPTRSARPPAARPAPPAARAGWRAGPTW